MATKKKREEMIWSFCNNGSQYFDCEFFYEQEDFLMHALFCCIINVMCTYLKLHQIHFEHFIDIIC